MNVNSGEVTAVGSMVLAATSGASSYFHWFDFVNHHAPGIGIFLSFFFGAIGTTFMIKTYYKDKQVDLNKEKIGEMEEYIDAVKNEMQLGFERILNKIG